MTRTLSQDAAGTAGSLSAVPRPGRRADSKYRAISPLYSAAFSRIAWPPRASSWLTSPRGDSFRSTLAMTCSDTAGRQTGRIMSAVMSMSRPK